VPGAVRSTNARRAPLPIHCHNRQILNDTMKPTPELRRKMRLRSEELRRHDETEWAFVRSCLREAAPKEIGGLAFDDRAWEIWFRFRGDLPLGWHEDWLPMCIEHASRYLASKERPGRFDRSRLRIAARRELGGLGSEDLALLRAELYRIAELALDIEEVAE